MADLLRFAPRNGQWCKFHITDEKLAGIMRGAGCFETPDGFFLSIWRAPGVDAITAEPHSGKLMCVDEKGENVPILVRDLGQVFNVSYSLDDQVIADLHPMTSKEHFPPKYVGLTDRDPRL